MTICKEIVVYPFNFGTDHSRVQSSGRFNFTLLDKGDMVIKANPLIMSLNSTVIENRTVNEGIFELLVNEFCSDVVHFFIELCYEGRVKGIDRKNFRDLFTLSKKLKVTWITEECEIFYSNFVKQLTNKSNHIDLRFATEEANYQLETYKKKSFLNLIANKINSKVLISTRE